MLKHRYSRLAEHAHRNADAVLERWRNDPATQEQLRQSVVAVLTDIFVNGEEVPAVVSAPARCTIICHCIVPSTCCGAAVAVLDVLEAKHSLFHTAVVQLLNGSRRPVVDD